MLLDQKSWEQTKGKSEEEEITKTLQKNSTNKNFSLRPQLLLS
jgi:hypothetical protein